MYNNYLLLDKTLGSQELKLYLIGVLMFFNLESKINTDIEDHYKIIIYNYLREIEKIQTLLIKYLKLIKGIN